MDATTQIIIDKIKRLSGSTDADSVVVLTVGDTFDTIKTETGVAFEFVDDTDYEITPTVAGTTFGCYREAIVYAALMFIYENKAAAAASTAVVVKSGRDMVDTTKAAGSYVIKQEKTEKRFKEIINRINGKLAGREIIIEAEE